MAAVVRDDLRTPGARAPRWARARWSYCRVGCRCSTRRAPICWPAGFRPAIRCSSRPSGTTPRAAPSRTSWGTLLEREEFLEPSSRFLQSYASFYKVFRRNSEEYLKNLQLPVRSDITRIAGLVVNLEEKVDRIEEVLEDFEYGYAEPATGESIKEVENRLDRVEGKLDRLLAALEGAQERRRRQVAETVAETNGSACRGQGHGRRQAQGAGDGRGSIRGRRHGERRPGHRRGRAQEGGELDDRDGQLRRGSHLGRRGHTRGRGELLRQVQPRDEDRRRGRPGRHRPDAEGDDLDQEQGQALPLRAQRREEASRPHPHGLRPHQPALHPRPHAGQQLYRVPRRRGLRRLHARLGHPRRGGQGPDLRELRPRLSSRGRSRRFSSIPAPTSSACSATAWAAP